MASRPISRRPVISRMRVMLWPMYNTPSSLVSAASVSAGLVAVSFMGKTIAECAGDENMQMS
jgi:hypothetical protein